MPRRTRPARTAVNIGQSLLTDEEAAEVIQVLIDLLKKPAHEEIQIGAAEALGEIGPAAGEAVPLLKEMLKTGSYGQRRGAVLGLGGIGSPGALPVLKAAQEDPAPEVRKLATEAVSKIEAAASVASSPKR